MQMDLDTARDWLALRKLVLAFEAALLGTLVGPAAAQQAEGPKISGDWTNFATYQAEGQQDRRLSFGGKLTISGSFLLGADSGWSLGVTVEAGYGRALTEQNSLTIAPTVAALLTPEYGENRADLLVSLTKEFAGGGSLTFGKVNFIDLSAKTPLLGGGGREGFQHLQFAAPLTIYTPPVGFGAVLSVPLGRIIGTFALLHPDSAARKAWPDNGFSEGVSGFAGITVPVKIGGQPGYEGLKLIWTSKNQLDFGDTDLILVPGAQIGQTDGGAAVQYSFQQYLVSDPAVPGSG